MFLSLLKNRVVKRGIYAFLIGKNIGRFAVHIKEFDKTTAFAFLFIDKQYDFVLFNKELVLQNIKNKTIEYQCKSNKLAYKEYLEIVNKLKNIC